MDKSILKKLSYGMYIITSKEQDLLVGCTANSVMQINSDTVAISLNNANYTTKVILEQKKFAINILPNNTDIELIKTFGFKKSNEVKTKYEELSASKYTDFDNDYNAGVLVELKKCFNNKVRIDDNILLKTILNKLESAILNDVSKPMNTAVVNNMISKSIETQEKQREIDEIKQQLKKAEKEQLETNLTSLSIQNDLFLK